MSMHRIWILAAIACLTSPAPMLAQNRKGQTLAGIWAVKGQKATWNIAAAGSKRFLLTGRGGPQSEPARMIMEIAPRTYTLKVPEPSPTERYDKRGRLAGLDATLHLNGDILKLDGWAIINGKRASQVHTTLHRAGRATSLAGKAAHATSK